MPKPKYLSLIDNPPPGFTTGVFGKRELLSGVVVLLAADCESAYALLPEFRTRVEGVVLTLGEPAAECVGPLLWHVSLPRDSLDRGCILLEAVRSVIAQASRTRDEAAVARLALERLTAEQTQRSDDYHRVADALHGQVALLAASENKLQTILDSVDACIYLKDTQHRYLFANRATRDLLKRRADEIIGFSDSDFFDEATAARIRRNDTPVLQKGRTIVAEETNTIRHNGKTITYHSTKLPLFDEDGRIYALCGISTDITVLKEREAQLKHIAHYDMLTMLPNRVLLADRLHQAMILARRRRKLLAVVYLDLDGFKAINDRHGHDVGDQLLVALAGRMKETLRDSDTLARLGGDEFIAVLLDLPDSIGSVPMIERLLGAAAQPVPIGELMLNASASLGVTFYPQADDVDADQLLRQADQAMYQAKLAGKNRFHFFDAEKDRTARGMHASLEQVRQALERQQLVLHYQPKVNMRSGEIIGVEALLRWDHPEQGLLLPDGFLPLIENHPLAIRLGSWVLEEALNRMEAWQAEGIGLPVSINIGARQLLQPAFSRELRDLLRRHPSIRPAQVEIEILETSALEDLVQVSKVIDECRAIGIRFSLDDFGTGYSSLSYLKRLPVDQLKIDRSFVSDMLDDPDDLTILDGVIGLAAAFGRQVIAEGVETDEHARMLLRLGCELGQGYGIARPMPGDEIASWVRQWRPDASWSAIAPVRRELLPLLYAVAEHRSWIKTSESPATARADLLPLHQKCRFEAWWRSTASQLLPQASGLDEAEVLHDRVHRLIARCIAGEEEQDMQDSWSELRTAVDDFIVGIFAILDASGKGQDGQR